MYRETREQLSTQLQGLSAAVDDLQHAAGVAEGFQEEEAKRRQSHIESRMRQMVFSLHSRSSGAVFGSWKHLWEAGRRMCNAMARSKARYRRRRLRAGVAAWAAVARAEVRQRQAAQLGQTIKEVCVLQARFEAGLANTSTHKNAFLLYLTCKTIAVKNKFIFVLLARVFLPTQV